MSGVEVGRARGVDPKKQVKRPGPVLLLCRVYMRGRSWRTLRVLGEDRLHHGLAAEHGASAINESWGAMSGSRLLASCAMWWRTLEIDRSTGDADREGLGGDEFVVLVESRADELDDRANTFSVTASIGVAAGQYATPDALLRDADLALYAAKAVGKNRTVEASMCTGV
jgi:predicted signal transduction protein with EAL and GGDEF domain